MFLNPRYDSDPKFYDKDGLKCSMWLFEYYHNLNGTDDRTELQNNHLDLIFEAARNGRDALNEVENKLKKKNGRKIC